MAIAQQYYKPGIEFQISSVSQLEKFDPSEYTWTGHHLTSWTNEDGDIIELDKVDYISNKLTTRLSENWVANEHQVSFYDWDYAELKNQIEQYGSRVVYPDHPDSRPDYDPDGWNPQQIYSMPDNDVSVVAKYKIKQFQVTFVDEADRAKFIEPEKYNKKYDIHSVIQYPEICCEPVDGEATILKMSLIKSLTEEHAEIPDIITEEN